MNFRQATDGLKLLGVTQEEIAKALGIAPATVRASRLPRRSPSYREPPQNWSEALVKLARSKGGRLTEFADELERK